MTEKKITDMTTGTPLEVITAFAVPMILSNLFQQLYNVIDSMIVGNWLGMQPFAAVGSTGMITAVLVQLSTGLALGGSVVVSQLFGAGRRREIRTCTTTLAIFMAALALFLTVLVLAVCRPLLSLVQTPVEVAGYAATYLRIYALGCLPIFLYNALSGIYTALGNSRAPLRFLLISSLANIALDLLFIICFRLGVGGAAAATVISQALAFAMALADMPGMLGELGDDEPSGADAPVAASGLRARRGAAQNAGRKAEKAAPSGAGGPIFDGKLLHSMLRLALPAALQQSVVSVGNVMVQATINSFGTVLMAASAAALKIINLTYAVPVNYGNAFANYVGQNMGARRTDRVHEGLRDACLCCGAFSLVVMAATILFAGPMVRLFVGGGGADPAMQAEVLDIGTRFIRVNGCFFLIFSLYMVIKAVFKGSGDMGWFIFVTMISFLVRLVLTIGLSHRVGTWIIWWSIGIGQVVALVFSIARFVQGGWKKKADKVIG